jgi:hypothetical protein
VKSRYPIQLVNYFLPNGTFSPNFGQYPETSDSTPQLQALLLQDSICCAGYLVITAIHYTVHLVIITYSWNEANKPLSLKIYITGISKMPGAWNADCGYTRHKR